MRFVWLISLGLVLAALVEAVRVNDRWSRLSSALRDTAALEQEVAGLAAERAALESTDDELPLKYAPDALSEFFTRALEAGEVLGTGVRIEARNALQPEQIAFQEGRHGLKIAPAALTAAAPAGPAPALFALLEEELRELPAAIRKAEARVYGDSVSLRLEVDVFAR